MSSNCNVDITRPFNDIDLDGKNFVKSSDFFDIIGNIEERLERLAFKFSNIRNERNNDLIYSDICKCFLYIADDLKEIKNGLKK